MTPRRRIPWPACGGQTEQSPGPRLPICLVCHRHVPEGRGVGFPHLRASVCRVACADVVREQGRAGGESSQARWRPRSVARAAIDGAGCAACRGQHAPPADRNNPAVPRPSWGGGTRSGSSWTKRTDAHTRVGPRRPVCARVETEGTLGDIDLADALVEGRLAVQQWQYMTWRITNGLGEPDARVRFVNGEELASKERPALYEALVHAGEDGWELVAATDSQGIIFKRPLPEG
jgi:hypothetical protein